MANRDEILALDRRFVWHPYTAIDDERAPLVVARAEGSRFFDVDGRSFLDGNSSWWVAGLGHNHPRLVRALVEQAGRMCHVSLAGVTHEPAAALAEELIAVAPVGLERVFFSDDGSTAVEAAIKIAVQHFQQTGRPEKRRFVALSGAFHGETAGAASLGGIELFRRASTPLLFDVVRIDWRAAFERARGTIAEHAAELAAVVVEPVVQGADGMQIYDPRWLTELAAVARQHDVLLIADEVFSGYGRTGRMWACNHARVTPDLMCVGKTFAGGLLPMAATLVTGAVADAFRGGRARAFLHGHSFCGNPLGAAVARAAIAVMHEEQILGQVRRKAPRLRAAVETVARLGHGTNPRAIGMVAAVDLLGGTGYLGEAGWRVYDAALSRGAYLRPLGDTLYLTPPLNILDDDLDELCSIFVDSAAAANR